MLREEQNELRGLCSVSNSVVHYLFSPTSLALRIPETPFIWGSLYISAHTFYYKYYTFRQRIPVKFSLNYKVQAITLICFRLLCDLLRSLHFKFVEDFSLPYTVSFPPPFCPRESLSIDSLLECCSRLHRKHKHKRHTK